MRSLIARYLPGAALILAAWALGNWLTAFAGLPIPPAVTGMALLFLAFLARPALAEHARAPGDLLLRNLPLFLYPAAVGFLSLPHFAALDLVKLGLAIFGSLAFAMIICARVFRGIRLK
ncbi:CidA/LrgA family protein [Paracoccus aminophilus]|uniref:LrgA family protein n=1 Tax=Paracoccus aminophilus JCM 7686 TaxID=1367847 RepID=S5XZG0_PARAH|nr:CidA/LrgA family protein [Paracoccus aminophilus]AGT10677.1 LrgA family protein [Paracoccus aminophilus JCM 7686]